MANRRGWERIRQTASIGPLRSDQLAVGRDTQSRTLQDTNYPSKSSCVQLNVLLKRHKTLKKSQSVLLTEPVLAWLLAILLGLIYWAGTPFKMNADGLGYLHVADGFARGDWSWAINACWSPLYPALIAAFTTVLHPSLYWEDPMVHGKNFLCYQI